MVLGGVVLSCAVRVVACGACRQLSQSGCTFLSFSRSLASATVNQISLSLTSQESL